MASTTCRTAGLPPERPPSKFPYEDDLSFRGFAQEALFGYGTQRTAKFDDYTKESYHVQPLQLLADLPSEARLYGIDLRAVVVVGPFGPLWAYDVIVKLPRFGGRVDCVTHVPFQRPSVWAVGAVEIAKRFPRTLWAARPFAPSTGPAASMAPQNCSVIMLPAPSG